MILSAISISPYLCTSKAFKNGLLLNNNLLFLKLYIKMSQSNGHNDICPRLQVASQPELQANTFYPDLWDQGGILAAKVPRILAGSLEPSGEVLNKNHTLLRYNQKTQHFCLDFISKGSNIPEISCTVKKFLERNSLSQEEISCLRGKFSVTGRHILSQKEFSSQKTKLQAIRRNFL